MTYNNTRLKDKINKGKQWLDFGKSIVWVTIFEVIKLTQYSNVTTQIFPSQHRCYNLSESITNSCPDAFLISQEAIKLST